MSRVIAASCVNGVVSVGGYTVDAKILTSGVKSSEGVLILNGDDLPVYITANTTDLSKLIEDIVDLITSVTTVLTSLDAVTNSPGAAASSIVQITTKKIALNLSKDSLK